MLDANKVQKRERHVGRYLDQIEEATVRFVENVEKMFAAFPEREP